MKNRLWTTLASSVCALAIAGAATAQSSVAFNIPAGDLKSGLEAYARQSSLELVYRVDDVEGSAGKAVRGDLPPLQALRQLLDGSQFEVRQASSGAYVIVRAAVRPAAAAPSRSGLVPISTSAAAVIQTAPTPAPADFEPVSVDEIVVTGSRIVRNDLTASSPLTVVGEDDFRATGSVSVENVLNDFPQLAGGRTSTVNGNGGAGVLTANLRSLGPTRTLVLVNGRRFIPADSEGTVDLAAIPDALIQRVEIVTGGASAVYGSDAIAGAVNFILKRDFEGLEMAYTHGETFEGDGASDKIDITFGANLDGGRGNVVFSASHSERDPVLQSARAFSAVPLDTINGELMPGGSGNVPGTRIGLSAAQRAQLVGVNLNPDGACSSITGIVFAENGVAEPYCNPEGAYNYADLSYLQRPLERTQLSALARYNISDRVEAFAEGYYVSSRNDQFMAEDSITLSTPGAGSSTFLVPDYATNPILSSAVRDFFVDNAALFDADGDGTAAVVGAARRFNELGPRHTAYERSSFALTGGVRGSFDMLDNPWRWEAFYQYQRNRGDTARRGTVSSTRLSQALDTVVVGGDVRCVNDTLGCVPVGVFGYDSISPEAAEFLAPYRTSHDIFERKVAGASISGDLWMAPAGPLSVALGLEHREDSYEYNPSPMDIAGEYATRSESPVVGSFDLTEVFGEFRLPILDGAPWADSLVLEGAARYGDYSTVGGVFTWKLGLEYAPVNWVRFRGAYNEAIRAPNINELFAAVRTQPTSGEDPCITSRNPTQAQKDLCVAQGVSASEIDNFQQSSPQFLAYTGGNANLREEQSQTYTVGVVVSPPQVPRLNLAVDYFDIEVTDAITSINANQTLNDCFSTLDQSSATCQAIQRLSNGQIELVYTNLQNIGALQVNGVDVQADYSMPLPDRFGLGGAGADLVLNASASWLFERSIQVLEGQPGIDCAGYFGGGCTGSGTPGTPDFKLRLGAAYASGPLSVRFQTNMIGKMELYPGVTSPVESVSDQWYADLSARFNLNDSVELFGGIENLFDNQPPIQGVALTGDANTDVAVYDVLGRRYFAGLRLRF